MKQTLVLGGPGAGKTDRLIAVMRDALDRGMEPSRIALMTFTKAAAGVAKSRIAKDLGLEPSDMPYVRTFHSFAFRELGLRRENVIGENHLAELSELTGELMLSVNPSFDEPSGKRNADELLTIDHFARVTGRTLHAAWEYHNGDIDWYRQKRFSDSYRLFKNDHGLLDFTDMLSTYTSAQLPRPQLQMAIIDEGQDLNDLQWSVADHAFAGVDELWIAGDDDQSIHAWSGAADERFQSLPYEREILPLSHRLPRTIFDFAGAVIRRVSKRYEKDWQSAPREGKIEWINRLGEVDLSGGTWLLIARTRAQLSGLISLAREAGVTYTVKGVPSVNPDHIEAIKGYEELRAGKRVEGRTAQLALEAAGIQRPLDETRTYTAAELSFDAKPIWHDALIRIAVIDREYYLACLRRGESLTKPPRIVIDTIHGVKGMEAENVLMLTDLTYRTHKGYRDDPDGEHRVFYVGLTRAIENLFLVSPQSSYGYPL